MTKLHRLEIWRLKVKAEVDAGFLSGPFSADEITRMVESDSWSLSKRFALYQGDERKIRIIDNYRDSGVNAAFASQFLLLQTFQYMVFPIVLNPGLTFFRFLALVIC